MTHSLSGSKLTIENIFQADAVVKCICLYRIDGSVSGLEKRSCSIELIYDDRYHGGQEIIDS